MPEGPEIRRAADRIKAVLEGRIAVRVELHPPRLAAWSAVLSGRRVEGVTTRGKAMLTRFAGGLVLYSHNQLYGRWYVVKRGAVVRTSRSLRVAIHTEQHSALLYSASDIHVLDEGELAAHPFLGRIGPDLLDPLVDDVVVRERLRDPAFRGRRLSSLYLDQSFLAGIGNYLRSEILFVARVAPEQRPQDLAAAHLRALARATIAVTRCSYESGGITLDERLEAKLKKEGTPRWQRRFWVYKRDGRPCRKCETIITRIDTGGRGLFFCSSCQGGPRPPRPPPRSGSTPR